MAEWDGKLIEDMSTSHIERTMGFLLKKAAIACKKVHGTDKMCYLDPVYFDLKAEFEKRDFNF